MLFRALDPRITLLVVLAALTLINLAMTAISSVQAWRADPRFLSGTWLGLLQLFVGLGLAAVFIGIADGFNPLSAGVAGAFVVGGLVVLAVRTAHLILRPVRPKGSHLNHSR